MSRLQNTDTPSVKSTPNSSAPSTPRPAPAQEDWDSLLTISPRRRISPLSSRLGARSRPTSVKNDSTPSRTPRISSLNLNTSSNPTSSRNSSAPRTPTFSDSAQPASLSLQEEPRQPEPARPSATPVVPSFLTGWDGADGWGDDPSLDDSDPEADEGTWGEWGDVGDITIPEEKNDIMSDETPTAPVSIQSSESVEEHPGDRRATAAANEKGNGSEAAMGATSPVQMHGEPVQLENKERARETDLAVQSIGETMAKVVERTDHDADLSKEPPSATSPQRPKSPIPTHEQANDAGIDEDGWGTWGGFDESQPSAEQNVSSFSMLPEASEIPKPPDQPCPTQSGLVEEEQQRSELDLREQIPANDPASLKWSEDQTDSTVATRSQLETAHTVSEQCDTDHQSLEIRISGVCPGNDFQNDAFNALETYGQVSVPEDHTFNVPQDAESPKQPSPDSNSMGHFNAANDMPAEDNQQHSYTLFRDGSLQHQSQQTGTSNDSRNAVKEGDKAETDEQGFCERDEVLATFEQALGQNEKQEEGEAWEGWDDDGGDSFTIDQNAIASEENEDIVNVPPNSETDVSAQRDTPVLADQIHQEQVLSAKPEAEDDDLGAGGPQLSAEQDTIADEAAEEQHEASNLELSGEVSTNQQVIDFGVPDDVPQIEDDSWGGWGDADDFAIPEEGSASLSIEEAEETETVPLHHSDLAVPQNAKDEAQVESDSQNAHPFRVAPSMQTQVFESVREVHNETVSFKKEAVDEDYAYLEPSALSRDARCETDFIEPRSNEVPLENREDIDKAFSVARHETGQFQCTSEGFEQCAFQEQSSREQFSLNVQDTVNAKSRADMPAEGKEETSVSGERSGIEEESQRFERQEPELSGRDVTQSAQHCDTAKDQIMDSFRVSYQPQSTGKEWGGWDDGEFTVVPDAESAQPHAHMVRKDENREASDLGATVYPSIDSASSIPRREDRSTQLRHNELGNETREELSTEVLTKLGERNEQDVQQEHDKVSVQEGDVFSLAVPPKDAVMHSFVQTNAASPGFGSWGGWEDSSEIAHLSQPNPSKTMKDVLQPVSREPVHPVVPKDPHTAGSPHRTPFENMDVRSRDFVPRKTTTAPQTENMNQDLTMVAETFVTPEVKREDEDTHISTQAAYASSYWTQKLNDGNASEIKDSTSAPVAPSIPVSQSTEPVRDAEEDRSKGRFAFKQESDFPGYDPFAPTGDVVQTEQPFLDGFDLEISQTEDPRPDALWFQTEAKNNMKKPRSERMDTNAGEPFDDYSFNEPEESKPRMDDGLPGTFTHTAHLDRASEPTPVAINGKAIQNESYKPLTPAGMESLNPVEYASDKKSTESETPSYLPSLDHANVEGEDVREIGIAHSKSGGEGPHDSSLCPDPSVGSRIEKEPVPTDGGSKDLSNRATSSAEVVFSSHGGEIQDATSVVNNQGHPNMLENEFMIHAPHQERLLSTNPNISNAQPEFHTGIGPRQEPLQTQASLGIESSSFDNKVLESAGGDNRETHLDSFLAPTTEPGDEKKPYAPNRVISSTETSTWGERKESPTPQYPFTDRPLDSHNDNDHDHNPQSSQASIPRAHEPAGAYDIDLRAYAPKQTYITANTAHSHPSPEASGPEDHSISDSATGSIENPSPVPYPYAFAKNQDGDMPAKESYPYQAYQSSTYNHQGSIPAQEGYSYSQAIEGTHVTDSETLTNSVNPYAPNPVSAQGHMTEVFENAPMDPCFGSNGPVSVPQSSLPQAAFDSYNPSGFSPFEAPPHTNAETVSNVQSVRAGTAEEGSKKTTDKSVSATQNVNIPEVHPEHSRLEPDDTMPNLAASPSHPSISATETYPQYTSELPGYAYGEYYTDAPEAAAGTPADTQHDSTYLDATFFSYPFSIMDTSPSGDMIHPGPRPIVTWGFAGSMVAVFPRQQHQTELISSSDAQSSGHTVQLYDMSPLGRDGADDDWIAASEAVHPLSYPLKTSDLEPYAKMCDKLSQLSAGLEGPAAEGRAALWRTLALLCRTEGEDWRKEAGHAVCGPTSVPLFGRNDLQSAPLKGQAKDLLPSHTGQSADETRGVATEVERLLTEGKGVEAVNFAKKSGMWSLALILSGMVDTKLYTSILCDYAKNILQEGSALQTLCFSLAENDAEITRRITSPAGLDEWRKNVGILLTSGASVTTSKARETRFLHLIEQVGDALLTQHADMVGAHVCYLLSGRLGRLDPKGICLLGANPSTPPGRPRSLGSPGSILQSVVYEAAMNARSGAAFPHLLPFRLLLAQEIASVGHPDIALAHCDSISKQVRVIFESRNSAIAAQFTAPFLSSLESFDQRLRAHLGLREEVGNLTKLTALGKSLSSVFSRASKERHSIPSTSADRSQDHLPSTASFATTTAMPYEERNTGVSVSMPFNHPPHLSVDSQWGAGYNSLQPAGFINQNSNTNTQATKIEKSGKEKWDQFVSKTVGLIAPADYDLSPPPPSRVPPSMAQHPAPIGLDGGSGLMTNMQGLAPNHMRSSSVGAIPSAFFNSTPALTVPKNGGMPHSGSQESGSEKSVPLAVVGKSGHAVLNGVPLQKATREENNDAIVHRRSASDMTLQSQTSEKKPPLHPKKPARASNVTDTSATTDKPTQKKGWRERLKEKLTATFGGPPRAHMGEENKFVFDKKRGRWVIEGEEPTEEEDVPPPPPDEDDMFGGEGNRVQASLSYDPLPSTEQSAHNVPTLLRSQSAQDALGSNGFNYPYTEHTQAPASLKPPFSGPGSLDNSFGGDDGSAASVASAASAPVPYSAGSSSKISSSGTNNHDSNKYRRVGRPGRRAYVDTFNKSKPSMSTPALPTPARPAVPAYGGITAATGGGYNIFTPTPIPSTSTGDSNMAQGASSTTSVVETSDQLTTSLSDTSSSHNGLASNQPTGHVQSLKPPAHPSGRFSTGRQPRMMA